MLGGLPVAGDTRYKCFANHGALMSEAHMESGDIDDADHEADANPLRRLVTSVLIWVRSSFIAFVGTVGTVFLSLAILLSDLVLPSVEFGVIAAMCLIWAISAYLYAVGGYVVLKLIGYT